MVVCGDSLLVLGGVCGPTILADVEVFDATTGTWGFDLPLPFPAGYAAATLHDGAIWVIDGTGAPAPMQVLTTEACGEPVAPIFRECESMTRNHGEYVSCVARLTQARVRAGTMTRDERQEILREAAHSDVGQR